MIIFGIDPGMAIVGYCALDTTNTEQPEILTWGSIQTDKNNTIPERLLEIHNDLKHLLEEIKPDVIAIEELFFFKNSKTLVPVLEARGTILLTAQMFNIPIYEYTPLVIKQVLTGYGRAEKSEVKEMLSHIIHIPESVKLDDIIDAAAIAYCHMRQSQ
ncbi:MAG: crossover junction endodeoxyribonuclease RuvC [Vampirovibrionia bacterium]